MRPPHIDSSEIVSTAAFQVDEAWFECDGASRTRTGDLLGAIQATEMQNAEIADDLRGERAGNASL